ncbi:uncharacterized protein LOC126903168 [Daktulosphaira vitifoliae]|uniref:uncharacterized protein LOC126903168 n=1 Tax=Daktulosphaira vitifoliae TaxID=58002 RepID=UPI0021A9DC6E|nr:uncharacterized protein LOC126903168 [Daktulosphaira vitifoliae]
MIRVKEKIRYDINVHREQNKLILLNTRRGITVNENDEDDTFSLRDVRLIALKIKSRKCVTKNLLKLLKHALLNGQDYILEFFRCQGATDSLLHYTSSKDDDIKLAAIECFCNMALGDQKTCIKLAKLITPYLMIHINSLNFNVSSMSIWTLGNLSGSSEKVCEVLENQNVFIALVNCLRISTCDEVIKNTFYALKLMLKNFISHLKIEPLVELLHLCVKLSDTWKESFWIIYQISCLENSKLFYEDLMKHLFNLIHSDICTDIVCLVPILRTLGNIVQALSSDLRKNFLVELKSKGPSIQNILLKNKQIDLSKECAWLLGNVLNSLNVNSINNVIIFDFEEICSYLFV